jgi:hypothetical protein
MQIVTTRQYKNCIIGLEADYVHPGMWACRWTVARGGKALAAKAVEQLPQGFRTSDKAADAGQKVAAERIDANPRR